MNNLKLKNKLSQYKRIVVTGGSGFIGTNFIKKLLKLTNAKVFNIDKNNDSNIKLVLKKNNYLENKYQFLKADLSKELDVYEVISKANPDIVFHFAAESHVDISIENPSIFVESNILGTFNILNASLKHFEKLSTERQSIFKFHHISTDEVFGSLGELGLFNEESKYDPRSPYSASKAASDHLVRAWFHTYELPCLITNCSNNYGPWQYKDKLIPLVINKCISKNKIPLYGDGLNIRDWLFVEDHVDAILSVGFFGEKGSQYCIGGNSEKKNIEIVNFICKIFNEKNPKFDYYQLIEYVKDRKGHDKRYAIDNESINNDLGWYPEVNFEVGINLTINWYLENINWPDNL